MYLVGISRFSHFCNGKELNSKLKCLLDVKSGENGHGRQGQTRPIFTICCYYCKFGEAAQECKQPYQFIYAWLSRNSKSGQGLALKTADSPAVNKTTPPFHMQTVLHHILHWPGAKVSIILLSKHKLWRHRNCSLIAGNWFVKYQPSSVVFQSIKFILCFELAESHIYIVRANFLIAIWLVLDLINQWLAQSDDLWVFKSILKSLQIIKILWPRPKTKNSRGVLALVYSLSIF